MRKIMIITFTVSLLAVLSLGFYLISPTEAQPYRYGQTQNIQPLTVKNAWIVIDTTASAGDEPNDLAVTERTYVTVSAAAEGGDDKITIYGDDPIEAAEMKTWNVVKFRCIGITADSNIIHQVYLGTLNGEDDCELVYAGELDWDIGTQASTTATYELADAVAATAGEVTKDFVVNSPGGERVAGADLNLDGADLIVVLPTTVASNCKLLAQGRS